MTPKTRRTMSAARGMTLLETIAAIVILSSVSVATTRLLEGVSDRAATAQNHMDAANAIHAWIEADEPMSPFSITLENGAFITIELVPQDEPLRFMSEDDPEEKAGIAAYEPAMTWADVEVTRTALDGETWSTTLAALIPTEEGQGDEE